MRKKSYEEVYMEYLELVKAKEEAEETVIRNMIREVKNKREEESDKIIEECKRMEMKLDLMQFMS